MIYVSDTMGDADLRVAIVTDQGFADLRVCRVDSMGSARGEALWFFTPDRHMARTIIHFCSPGMAQLQVCFVSAQGQARWTHDTRRPTRRLR